MFSLPILTFILGILFLLVKRTPVVLLIEILKPFWSHPLCMISIYCFIFFSLPILTFILGILFLLVKRTPVVLLIEILKPFWSHQLCMISIDCCILFIRILTFLCPV